MRYGGLMKLGKKAFCVNFTLLDKLKITTKEAILLQQIEFVNNKSDYLVLPFVILSKITNMSRGHLYRCLRKLKEIGLIVITDEGIAITDYYKEIKQQDFLENHNKNKAIKLKATKIAENVACEIASKDEKLASKGENHSNIAGRDENLTTKDKNSSNLAGKDRNNSNIASKIAQNQKNTKAKNKDEKNSKIKANNSDVSLNLQNNKANFAENVACEIASKDEKLASKGENHSNIAGRDENLTTKDENNLNLAKDKSNSILVSKDRNNSNIVNRDENNLNATNKTNTQNNKENTLNKARQYSKENNANNGSANAQNRDSFFVTKVSQNETNLSQNETLLLYNKEYNNISLCDNSHKEYIYSLQKEAANKKQELRDSLALLLAKLKNNFENLETLDISGEIFKELVDEFQNKVQAQRKIKPNAFFSKLSDDTQKLVATFMHKLNTSLIFLSVEAKRAFFNDLEILANNGRLHKAIKYSIDNKCLWLCENGDDSKGREFLKDLYGTMQKELDKKIKKLQVEYLKSMSKEAVCREVMLQYGAKIDEFIAYREQRNRYLNQSAKNALYDTLADYFVKGQDVGAILEQSIYRGYNWVFPLTHRSRRNRHVA